MRVVIVGKVGNDGMIPAADGRVGIAVIVVIAVSPGGDGGEKEGTQGG